MRMINIENSCCFTGYRPEKFDFPLEESNPQYRQFFTRLVTGIADMINNGCTDFYCGMAQGFDIMAGEHVALIKKLNKRIRLIGVVPYEGQEKGWSHEWQSRYRALLAECDEVVTLNTQYTKWVFQQRNEYMVDRSRYCLTYFDGKRGGTDNTVKYAVKHSRVVLNIYDTDPNEDLISQFKCGVHLLPPEDSE